MIKAILFDFDQTLVDSAEGFRRAEKEAQEKIFVDLFGDQGQKDRDRFLSRYRKTRKAFHDRSDFSRLSMWQGVYAHLDQAPDISLLEEWERTYWERVKQETRPFPETLKVLEGLTAKYRLGLVTNTQGQRHTEVHRIALFPKIEEFFRMITVAGESDIPPKPDPASFQTCTQRLGILPDEAVFVGDDWRIDICGAMDAGLSAIWLQHHSVRRSWPEVETSVPIITSLEPLLSLEEIIG